MVKRKRASDNILNSKSKVKRFVSAFSLPEIDKILEERLSEDVIFLKGKTKYPSRLAMLRDDSTTMQDPINKLPTELLYLLSLSMTMREAATMGILSRGWRYLWRTYGKLNFDLQTITGEFEEHDMRVLQEKTGIFVRWVNEVLKLHCGPKIESFRVAYCLGEEHYFNIDEWIQFAVNKGVQKLNICLVSNCFRGNRKLYNLPHWMFTKAKHNTLTHLSLDLCSMDITSGFVSFRSLTSLTLRNGTMAQETLENILSNCLSLEWFSITACDSPSHLQFGGGGTSLKRRHLNISPCNYLKEIEIYDAVHISSFEYHGRKLDRLLFKNGPQVRRLCYDIISDLLASAPYALGCMASDFPRLETLMLSMPFLQKAMIPEQLPSFSKLRRLVLTFPYSGGKRLLDTVSTLLKMSPLMLKFELLLPTCLFIGRRPVPEITPFSHENLKVVEMYNFDGSIDQVEVVQYLFNSCIALKKMKIDPCWRQYKRDGEWITGSNSSPKPKYAYKLLRRNVPPSVKLVVL